ncbi:uncharacterized protein LOC143023744 [Oratosquilla oratoria]|uniref:uncharacterized protein LOC143023744 n=1 Tax=Oratosquilla oratoria TaxID=337810 RepID=UPI003F761A53
MLHFRCRVNGTEAVGFVDTGCALCTLSTDFVRRLGLEDQVDSKFAYGVLGPGGDHVLGCIHKATLEMGGETFVTNFDVMESDMDVWLGMDLIYREGIAVDVANSVLRITSTNTEVDLLTLEKAQEATLDEQPKKKLRNE